MINSRYLRNRRDRLSLYLQFNCKCADCGQLLQNNWHADHKIPWSKGGETTLNNMRATCPQCNLKKGNKMVNSFFNEDFPNSKNVRMCQIEAYNCAVEKLLRNEKSCSIFLPTGVGKSDLIRSLAVGLVKNRKKFAGVWAFSPSTGLKRQLAKDGIDEFLRRIGINLNSNPFIEEERLDNARFRGGEVLMESFTCQYLTTNGNVDDFVKWAKKLEKDFGKLPIAVFDESHLYSTDNQWGNAAIKLQEAGVPIILVTGTPMRSDDTVIPGFVTEYITSYEKPFYATKKDENDPLVKKVIRGTEKVSRYRLKADYEYSYSKAWEDEIILKPQPIFVDATATFYEKLLSEMDQKHVDRLLRTFLMNDQTIAVSIEACIRSLRQRQVDNDNCAAIVASLSDDTDEEDLQFADIHANKIKREFERQAPDLKILVVTSKTNAEDGLEKFKKGYDVLIVKAMGTIGFNCPRIKTVVNLSNVRTLPAFIQLINRGNRLLDPFVNFDVVMPKDKGMIKLWESFIEETQLVIETVEAQYDTETYTKEINETKESPKFDNTFENHTISGDPYSNRNKNDEIIDLFKEKLPGMANRMTNQQMLTYGQMFEEAYGKDCLKKLSCLSNKPLLDINEEESRLRVEANDEVKEITNEIVSVVGFNQYGEVHRYIWSAIKKMCGFKPNQSLGGLVGIDNYNKLIEAARKLKEIIIRWPENGYWDFKNRLKQISKNPR